MKTTEQYGKKADRALSTWVKLARASATMGKLSRENIESFGLTEPQFGVLEVLGHLGPITLGQLSKKRLVSGGNITCVVDNLEKEGLVARIPSPDDRRSIVVSLTDKGRELFVRIFVQHAECITQLVSVLSETEQEQLSYLCKKLGTALHKE